MHRSIQMLSLLVPLLLLGLVATAVIAFYRIRAYGLPISVVTATATLILPVITGAGLQRAYRIAAHANGRPAGAKFLFTWSSFVAFIVLIIYDTVIATLALTSMGPANDLICPLERTWSRFFSNKNSAIIRTIQERHQCCGFRNVQDRAWPFPDRSHTTRSCADTFDRQQSCLGDWRQDLQITAGLILLVAVTVFVLKLLLLVLYRTRNPSVSPVWNAHRNTNGENDNVGSVDNEGRDITARGQIEDVYHDEPNEEQLGNSQLESGNDDRANDQGPALQPSRLQQNENEWRGI